MKPKNILQENMRRFATKNLTEDADTNNNGYPDAGESDPNKLRIRDKWTTDTDNDGYVDLRMLQAVLNQIAPHIGAGNWAARLQRVDIKSLVNAIAKEIKGVGPLEQDPIIFPDDVFVDDESAE